MAIRAGLRAGLRAGIRSGLDSLSASVPKDGPGAVFVPTTAAQFTALGIEVPTLCFPCQEASGNLIPSIGSIQLPPTTTPLYQQAVTGWTRKFVGLDTGTADRFTTTDSGLDVAAGESYAMMCYASVSNSGAIRPLMAAQGSANLIEINTSGVPRTVHNSVATAFAASHSDLTVVHPWQWYRDATANASGGRTDLQEVTGTHNEAAFSAVDRGLGRSGSNSPDVRCCWIAMWKGAIAETINKSTLTKLGWSLSY